MHWIENAIPHSVCSNASDSLADMHSEILSINVNIKGAQGLGNVIWLGVWRLSVRERTNTSCHIGEQQTLACVTHGIRHDPS